MGGVVTGVYCKTLKYMKKIFLIVIALMTGMTTILAQAPTGSFGENIKYKAAK